MAKRPKKPEEGGAGFLTTYADIVTLLMAFFVLLFAISSVDQVKFLALLKGLEEDFGNTSYQNFVLEGAPSIFGANQPAGSLIPSVGGPISIIPIPDATELEQIQTATFEGVSASVVNPDGSPPNVEPAVNVLDLTGLLEVQGLLLEAAGSLGLDDAVTTEFRERGLVVALSTDDLLFQSGSAVLEDGLGKELIAVLAAVIAKFDNPVFVEGHTDNVPLHREGYDNWNLSSDRAAEVVKIFAGEFGIDGARLSSAGRAYFHPLAPNDSDENRALNRRVELVIGLNPEDISFVVGDRGDLSASAPDETNIDVATPVSDRAGSGPS